MKTTLKRTRAVVLHTIVFVLTIAFAASGQSTKISGTLRHGSGLLDIPVASVLPHMALTGTYSGFWTSNDVDFSTDGEGGITAPSPSRVAGTEIWRSLWGCSTFSRWGPRSNLWRERREVAPFGAPLDAFRSSIPRSTDWAWRWVVAT